MLVGRGRDVLDRVEARWVVRNQITPRHLTDVMRVAGDGPKESRTHTVITEFHGVNGVEGWRGS